MALRTRVGLLLHAAVVASEQRGETDLPLDPLLASLVLRRETRVAGAEDLVHFFEGAAFGFGDLEVRVLALTSGRKGSTVGLTRK